MSNIQIDAFYGEEKLETKLEKNILSMKGKMTHMFNKTGR